MPTKQFAHVGARVATSGTILAFTGSLSSFPVMGDNALRVGAIFYNNSDKAVYVAYGDRATPSLYSYQLASGSTYVMADPVYAGEVTAMWFASPGTGSLFVTELV